MDRSKGWDRRCVPDYSKIHGSDSEMFAALIKSMNIAPGMKIADVMGGYGGVTKQILEFTKGKSMPIEITLSDASELQIEKSYNFLREYENNGVKIKRKVEDAEYFSAEKNSLDKIIIKMGLHEVPLIKQRKIIENAYNSLKECGEFYIWNALGKTQNSTEYFRKVVAKKDELAGYLDFVKNRYFAHDSETIENLKKTGFSDVQIIYEDKFVLDTLKYCSVDFGEEFHKFAEFNDFIRKTVPENLKKEINFQDDGNNITLEFAKKLIRAKK